MPGITFALALLCCCFLKGNGITGNDAICEDVEMKHKSVIRRKGTRYVRRVTRDYDKDED